MLGPCARHPRHRWGLSVDVRADRRLWTQGDAVRVHARRQGSPVRPVRLIGSDSERSSTSVLFLFRSLVPGAAVANGIAASIARTQGKRIGTDFAPLRVSNVSSMREKIDHEKADPRALVFRRRVQVRFTFNQGVSFSEHTLDPFRQTRISTLPDSLALSDFPSPIVVIRLSSNLKFCTM